MMEIMSDVSTSSALLRATIEAEMLHTGSRILNDWYSTLGEFNISPPSHLARPY